MVSLTHVAFAPVAQHVDVAKCVGLSSATRSVLVNYQAWIYVSSIREGTPKPAKIDRMFR